MVSVCEPAALASSRWISSTTHSNDTARRAFPLPRNIYRYAQTHRIPSIPSYSSLRNEGSSDVVTTSTKKRRMKNLKMKEEEKGKEVKKTNYEERPQDDDDCEESDNETRRSEIKEKLSLLHTNARRLKSSSSSPYPASYSLGIDLGDARTGIAISKGFAPRPLEVVELKGQKLADYLIKIAEREKANEFIVGLPKSMSGLESKQCSKVRHFAGRLAVVAAQRGCCVYLYNEFGSSCDALDYMLMMGSTKKARRTRLDAYAAVILLQSYFENDGKNAELVVPKRLSLQQQLCEGPTMVDSDDDGDFED